MFKYLIFLIILSVALAGCTEQLKVDVTGVGETMPTSPTALSYDGKNLILAKEGLIAFIDNIDTANAASIYGYEGHFFFDRYPITITSKDNSPNITGLAYQKIGLQEYLWVADAANNRILKVTPQGDTVRTISLNKIYPEDITFDGQYLWIADSKRGKIFKCNTEDGSVDTEYLSPVKLPTALAWDGKYIFVAGIINPLDPSNSPDNVRIVKLDPNSGKVVEEIPNSRYISYPVAMVWIDGKLWIANKNSGYIVKISDWGSPSLDEKNYKIYTASTTPKKIETKQKESDKDLQEAKRAAEEAKRAAEEAKRAAEAAKKAFELQQKK